MYQCTDLELVLHIVRLQTVVREGMQKLHFRSQRQRRELDATRRRERVRAAIFLLRKKKNEKDDKNSTKRKQLYIHTLISLCRTNIQFHEQYGRY